MSARAVLLCAAALALAGCPRLDPMQRQAKYKAYQASEYFEDGLEMRAPPDGTVPYQDVRDTALTTGRGPDGKLLATSPVPVDATLLARGKERFEVNCAVCHGLVGDGQSQLALSMSLRRPPSLHLYRDRPDGYIFQVITQGFGLMPSYARLAPHDRWAVVAYVRALQLSQHAPAGQLPAELRRRLDQEAP